jgi:hypothetical protein
MTERKFSSDKSPGVEDPEPGEEHGETLGYVAVFSDGFTRAFVHQQISTELERLWLLECLNDGMGMVLEHFRDPIASAINREPPTTARN